LPDGEVTRQGRRVEPLTLLIGVSMTIGYGTLYYPFAILGPEIARAQGWSNSFVFGVFSVALLTSAVTASLVGHAMDRFGARPVMVAGSCLAALALVNLSAVDSMTAFFVAMLIIELGARMVQYETGFAALTAIHGRYARRPIAHVTLVAGFASTVFWPLIHWLLGFMDWRGRLPGSRRDQCSRGPADSYAAIPRRTAGADRHDELSERQSRSPTVIRACSEPGKRCPRIPVHGDRLRRRQFPDVCGPHIILPHPRPDGPRGLRLRHWRVPSSGRCRSQRGLIEMLTGERVAASSIVGVISSAALLLGLACLAAGLWIDGELIVIIALPSVSASVRV
jgi:hypothetical protein